VADVAAYSVAAAEAEDEVMITVVPRPGTHLDVAELLRFCADRLPPYALPRYVDTAGELPRTATGKVEKYRLRERGVTPTTVTTSGVSSTPSPGNGQGLTGVGDVAFGHPAGAGAVVAGEGTDQFVVVGGAVLTLVGEHVEEVRRHDADGLTDQRHDPGEPEARCTARWKRQLAATSSSGRGPTARTRR